MFIKESIKTEVARFTKNLLLRIDPTIQSEFGSKFLLQGSEIHILMT